MVLSLEEREIRFTFEILPWCEFAKRSRVKNHTFITPLRHILLP